MNPNFESKLMTLLDDHRSEIIELRRYLQLRGKDNVEANRILDQWLWKHPEFRTCNPGGRSE